MEPPRSRRRWVVLGVFLVVGVLMLCAVGGTVAWWVLSPGGTSYLGEPLALVADDWQPTTGTRVLLDPGHGRGGGSPERPWTRAESVINLEVSLATGEHLGGTGNYQVFFTRLREDQDPSLSARALQATTKRADVFVSIHANATGTDPLEETRSAGIMVIWSPFQRSERARRDSEWLANYLGSAYAAEGLPIFSTAARADVVGLDSGLSYVATNPAIGVHADGRGLGVLRRNLRPAVLVETHFLNNRSDVAFFQDEATIARFAAATERGLRSFQAWKEGALQVGDPGQPYTIQVAARPHAAEAEAVAAELREAGIPDVRVEEGMVDTERWYRVRVGRFGSRAEVEVARHGLESRGYEDLWVVLEE